MKTISILGCGWYGLPLAKELLRQGYRIKGSTTSADKLATLQGDGIEPYLINFENGKNRFDAHFFDADLLIISIPPKSKSPSLKDYPDKIKAIASAAENAAIKQIILISSTAVYADGNFIVDEDSLPGPESESGKIIFGAEETLKQHSGFDTTVIRFAGLIGPNRNLAKHFAGKTGIANGLAPVNLIHLTDCIALTIAIIEQGAFGKIFHGVSPHHPTRAEFYTKNCLANGLEEPQFNQELLAWKQIESVNVPKLLDYRYQVNNWDDWLSTIS